MKKSAAAKLQTRNRGTSIFDLENINTNTTVPFPRRDIRNTTQTPHLKLHQSDMKSKECLLLDSKILN